VPGMLNSLEVKFLYPTWWRWRVSDAQGLSPRGGVWRKREAKVRADEQEPDTRRQRRTSGQRIAKSISIKGAKRRSGGCAPKAIELTPGDLLRVARKATEAAERSPDRGAEVSRRHSRSSRRQG